MRNHTVKVYIPKNIRKIQIGRNHIFFKNIKYSHFNDFMSV